MSNCLVDTVVMFKISLKSELKTEKETLQRQHDTDVQGLGFWRGENGRLQTENSEFKSQINTLSLKIKDQEIELARLRTEISSIRTHQKEVEMLSMVSFKIILYCRF